MGFRDGMAESREWGMGAWAGGMVSWSSIPGISTLTTDIMYLLLVSALVVSIFLSRMSR